MNNFENIVMAGFIALSVLTSFFFTFYGVNIIMSVNAPNQVLTFAYVTIAYGLGNLAILSLAWSTREKWALAVIKLFALIFFGVLIMDTLIAGFKPGTDLIRIPFLGLILWTNWLSVKKVVERN